MTIRRGDAWGRTVARPAGLRVVADDAALAEALADGSGRPTAVAGGDLARTLGNPAVGDRTELVEFPLDLMEVRLDGGMTRTAVAHVVVRSPWWRGSWWTGPLLAVMNAEFVGAWDVAPRGHPNDGRVEALEADTALSIRQRVSARRRLPLGTHVPHPLISSRSIREHTWTFRRPMHVAIDGRPAGRSVTVGVRVLADAAVVHA
jgi:hypothetical protein